MREKVKTLLGNYFALEDEFKLGKRWIQKIIKAVGNRACITKLVIAHILRHTFAVNCLKRDNIKTLQLLLGHDTLETTQIYLVHKKQFTNSKKKWR